MYGSRLNNIFGYCRPCEKYVKREECIRHSQIPDAERHPKYMKHEHKTDPWVHNVRDCHRLIRFNSRSRPRVDNHARL